MNKSYIKSTVHSNNMKVEKLSFTFKIFHFKINSLPFLTYNSYFNENILHERATILKLNLGTIEL